MLTCLPYVSPNRPSDVARSTLVVVWLRSGWFTSRNISSLLGNWDEVLLASAYVVIAIVSQCQVAPLRFPALEDVAGEKERAQVGTLGSEDQAITTQWVQDNADEFETQFALITGFGHNVGRWALCNLACNSKDEGLVSGIVPQSEFCEDPQGVQCK